MIQNDDVAKKLEVVFATVEIDVGEENPAEVMNHEERHESVDLCRYEVHVTKDIEFRQFGHRGLFVNGVNNSAS